MDILFTVLILLLMVSLSGIVFRLFPFNFPLPIIQIIMGALLAIPAFDLHIDFDPDFFLLMFIPPLLFSDGWKTPVREFVSHGREIVSMALVLVVVTVIGVGFLIHQLLPHVSFPGAFALAAVLSPTDAVALSGIVKKGSIPKKVMNVAVGEALMNDASGLVSLKFAVAVAMGAMSFTVGGAILEFLKVAMGGLAVGVILIYIYGNLLKLINYFSKAGDSSTQIVFLILLPFASYIIAEHIGVSGILAAVAAGMASGHSDTIRSMPLVRLRANNTWEMLEFVFNGMVFIMLGMQLPRIMNNTLIASSITHQEITLGWLSLCVVIIYTVLILLRFIWMSLMKILSDTFLKKHPMLFSQYSLRHLVVGSFAGVRGAVTLAGVLSIPLFLNDGSPFPGRYQLVFIASGVILLSLLVGIITLPLLSRGQHPDDTTANRHEELIAIARMAEASIRKIKEIEKKIESGEQTDIQAEFFKEASTRVLEKMRYRLMDEKEASLEHAVELESMVQRLYLIALHAERDELYQLKATHQIGDETLTKLLARIDMLEIVVARYQV